MKRKNTCFHDRHPSTELGFRQHDQNKNRDSHPSTTNHPEPVSIYRYLIFVLHVSNEDGELRNHHAQGVEQLIEKGREQLPVPDACLPQQGLQMKNKMKIKMTAKMEMEMEMIGWVVDTI